MDDSMKKLAIPAELNHPFFFSQEEILVNKPNNSFPLSENFIYELYFFNGMDTCMPWMNPQESVPILLEEWQQLKNHLKLLFQKRKQEFILESMKKGIGLFLQLLFWSNGKPVHLKEPIPFSQLTSKPVNVQERLDFIISRPKLFHSFIQLSELMVEQEKHYMKNVVVKKASRPNKV
jgi:hypothetical protein